MGRVFAWPKHDEPEAKLQAVVGVGEDQPDQCVRALPLLFSASPGGTVFFREFLLGDIEFCHCGFEVFVLEFLRWDSSVLFDLLGLAL